MDSFAENLTALDAVMLAAAVAALFVAMVSGAVVAVMAAMRERSIRMGIVVFAAGIEVVCCVVAPLVAWASVHEMALRFGAEGMQSMFLAAAIRAIAVLATALVAANAAAISLLVQGRGARE